MTEDEIEEALDEYDHLTNNVLGAGYKTFDSHLQRFLHFVRSNPVFAPIARRVSLTVDFDGWYEKAKTTVGGSVGSGSLDWPVLTEDRLGLWLGLLDALADGRESISGLSTKFLYAGTHYDDMVYSFGDQIFRPFSEDFRRLVAKETRKAVRESESVEVLAPASDRHVRISHNSPEFQRASDALDAAIEAVQNSNEYASSDPEDREQRLAELEAGKRLLQSVRVRPKAVVAVLGAAPMALAATFATGMIGAAAADAWAAIKVLIGI